MPSWCAVLDRPRLAIAVVISALLACPGVWGPHTAAAAVKQQRYSSAEAGVQALIDALKAGDTKALLKVLGPEARPLVVSGDPVADRHDREFVVQAYAEAHNLTMSGETNAILQVGNDNWPFPIPLVHRETGWYFDTPAGKQEILNRRIGKNELAAIEVCRAYVDAQREYYLRNPMHSALLHYAQKFLSTKGKRDGLFWPTKEGEELSPLGPSIVGARGEGYSRGKGGKPVAYHGYHYRILKAQGPDAPGGAYDYVVQGKMIGGFALVAYPASWANSGVMTFLVNYDGTVYQKDLGPDTAALARAMKRFNPDQTWERL